MMAKLKRQASASESDEEPQKRHRPLTFSIESIIASDHVASQESKNEEKRSPSVVSSGSSGSESLGYPLESSISIGVGGHTRNNSSATSSQQLTPSQHQQPGSYRHRQQQHHHQKPAHARSPTPTPSPPTSLSAGSSRASTPISPGAPAHHLTTSPTGVGSNEKSPEGSATNHGGGGGSFPTPNPKDGQTRQSSTGTNSTTTSTNQLLRPQVCRDPRLAPFECHLDNLDLWHRFHPLDTEMIITKQGRRMFPPVRVTFSMGNEGVTAGGSHHAHPAQQEQQQPNGRDKYQVLMDILPFDNKRYRYAYHKSSWTQAGKADPPSPTKLFLHPDGPFTLEQLKRQVISFEKIKLTNNDANRHGYIVLNSMHKYQPRIHLVLWRGKESQSLANAPISQLDQEIHKTFIFSETIFTAVTAYQNHSITKLKIDSNPFAKGFRDSSRLTDLELESMQDLMSDGQCPFSPPRAPPHGFPHFLFAAAAQQGAVAAAAAAHMGAATGDDPTSAILLRERTIMALDSFLQQQQQQHLATSQGALSYGNQSVSPRGVQNANGPMQPNLQQQQASQPPLPPPSLIQAPPPSYQQSQALPPPSYHQPQSNIAGPQSPAMVPSLQLQQPQKQQPPSSQASHIEQLIMQQQFAAMAAATAAAAHHPNLHTLFASNHHHHHHHQHRHQSPATPTGSTKAASSPLQLSPASSTPGAPVHQQGNPVAPNTKHPEQHFHGQTQAGAAAAAVAVNHYLAAFHPQHLQAAMMAAHHQHQMAALGMQLGGSEGRQAAQVPPPPPQPQHQEKTASGR